MKLPRIRLTLLCALGLALPVPGTAQAGGAVRVSSAQEALLAAPNGSRLAMVSRGTALAPGARRGGWREATLEGWIAARSVKPSAGGNSLVTQGAATLHASPDGAVVARASNGMALRQVERRGTWIRVRRTGWVWGESLETGPAAPPAAAPAAPAPARTAAAPARTTPAPAAAPARTASAPAPARTTPAPARTAPAPAPARTQPAAPARTAAAPAPAPAANRPPAAAMAAVVRRPAAPAAPAPAPARKAGAVVLSPTPSANAGTVAVVEGDAPVQVLARQGEWTRVRVEGWTRSPVAGGAPAGAGRITLRALRADPDAFTGRPVEWTLRFVSLQRADSLRTDMVRGEAYVLARDPDGETGFVYLAVPPAQVAAVRRLAPFQPFRAAGRIRVARSPLMGHPIVDLVQIR